MRTGSALCQRIAWVLTLAVLPFSFVQPTQAQPHAEDPHASSAYTEVPLTYDTGGLPVVSLQIGSQDSLSFVIDTAAARSVIAPWVRNALNLSSRAVDTLSATGASGEQVSYPTLRLNGMTLGDQSLPSMTLLMIDLTRFEGSDRRYAGILGNDVLKAFDVEIDYPNRRLRLYPIDERSVSAVAGLDAMQKIPFEDVFGGATGFVKVPLAIGDSTVPAILDTGAGRTIFNPQAAALSGWTEEGAEQGPDRFSGLNADTETDIYVHTVRGVAIGATRFPPTDIRVIDLGVFRSLGIRGPGVILGNDFLAGRRLVISYSTGYMYLSEPRSGASQ